MKRNIKHVPRWLIALLFCCIGLTAYPAEVRIEGYTSISSYNGYPLYNISSSSIKFSSSVGRFNYVYVDDRQLYIDSSTYWASYNLDISGYLDGQLHSIQLKSDTYDYGICYFTNNDNIDGIFYNVTGEEVSVTGALDEIESANILSEYEYNGITYPVTSIGSAAFSNCSGLTSVIIPNSVTSIDNYAFNGCSGLKELTIKDGEGTLSLGYNQYYYTQGKGLFFDCPLEKVYLGRNISYNSSNYYGYSPFYGKNTLLSLTIGNSVTSIGSSAFYNCSGLTSVVIPNSVTSIDWFAFEGCSGLKKSAYPNTIEDPFCYGVSISYPAESAEIEDGWVCDANKSAIYFAPLTIEGEYEIPYSVISIGSYAFYNCSGLTSVVIPNSVTSIEDYAFNGCAGLKELTIEDGEGTLSLGCNQYYSSSHSKGLFFDCPLEKVSLGRNISYNSSYTSGYSPFYGKNTLLSLTIGNSVTSIDSFAFEGCSGLPSVIIPNSVTSIGPSAFYNCSGLTCVVIPNSVTSIGSAAFSNCSGLTSVVIPNSVRSIGSSTFSNCNGLASVVIPNSVRSIDSSAFSGCSGLTSVVIPNSVRSIGSAAFSNCSGLTSVIIPNSVTSIGSAAFSNCRGLTSVVIPNFVTSIASSTFSNCSGLTSVVIPNSVTSIKSAAFEGCSGLTSLTIPESVTSIEEKAFGGCSSLTSLAFNAKNCTANGSSSYPVFPNSLTSVTFGIAVSSIPDYFLYGCNKIERIVIPNSVTEIGSYAIYDNQLKSVTIGSGVRSIGSDAFYRSSGKIAKAYWLCNTPPTGVNNINVEINFVGNNEFGSLSNTRIYQFLSSNFTVGGTVYVPTSPSDRTCDVIDCTYDPSITELTIPNKISNRGIEFSVNKINDYSFYENNSIKTANISNGSSIGTYAFYNCTQLHNLEITNEGSIGNYAFSNNSALQTASISNKGDIRDYAFFNNSALQTASISNNGAIGDHSFANCSNLNNAVIGNDVASIGSSGFQNCSCLPELTLPNSVTLLGEYAFSGCAKLQSIHLGTGLEILPRYVCNNCSSLQNISIPSNVKEIRDYAFSGCQSLSQLSLEDSELSNLNMGSNGSSPLFKDCPLEEVFIGRNLVYNSSSSYGYSPFYRNMTLNKVVVSDVEDQISDNEFYGCSNLQSITIGNGVTSIGKWAFSGCSSLDYFSAGYNVKSIGDEAFSDCTALTNYYSFSPEPPVCGPNALDDINKWDCALYVPAESSDEYKAASQWKEFFFVNETDAVLIESLAFNEESHNGLTGDTYQLEPQIEPANATRKSLQWVSSSPATATVDENGLLTFIKEGTTTITAHTTDGSGLEASIEVTVSVKNPEIGDSNGNGAINVADAVNIVNHIIGNEVSHIDLVASDVNSDGRITISDASALVSMILDQPVAATSMKIRHANVLDMNQSDNQNDILILDDFEAKAGETAIIPLRLENAQDYVAMQGDLTVPEGMEITEVTGGENIGSHSLLSRRIDNRTMRVILFDISNSTFADDDEPLLLISAKVIAPASEPVKVCNAVISDTRAVEWNVKSSGGFNRISTGIDDIDCEGISISSEQGAVIVKGAVGKQITINDMSGRTVSFFTAKSETESIELVSGVYIVTAGRKEAKIIVK